MNQLMTNIFFGLISAGILLSSGSATAAPLDGEQLPVDSRNLTAIMNRNVREMRSAVMDMISSGINGGTTGYGDQSTVRAMRETMMQERPMYKKIHSVMVDSCAKISMPKSPATADAVDKKNAEGMRTGFSETVLSDVNNRSTEI